MLRFLLTHQNKQTSKQKQPGTFFERLGGEGFAAKRNRNYYYCNFL